MKKLIMFLLILTGCNKVHDPSLKQINSICVDIKTTDADSAGYRIGHICKLTKGIYESCYVPLGDASFSVNCGLYHEVAK